MKEKTLELETFNATLFSETLLKYKELVQKLTSMHVDAIGIAKSPGPNNLTIALAKQKEASAFRRSDEFKKVEKAFQDKLPSFQEFLLEQGLADEYPEIYLYNEMNNPKEALAKLKTMELILAPHLN